MSKKSTAPKTTTRAPKTAKTKPEAEVPVETTPMPETPAETAAAKPARKAKEAKPKKMSAIDAAAQVLAAKGEPMTAPELIAAMSEQGLWNSPGGKTPAATLYSALLREITTKGAESRFSRPERGKFATKAKN